jgi:hypothetical protein
MKGLTGTQGPASPITAVGYLIIHCLFNPHAADPTLLLLLLQIGATRVAT